MASSNYFQDASRPYRPSTPRLSTHTSYMEKESHGGCLPLYDPLSDQHGLGISGVHVRTSNIIDHFLLPSPLSDDDGSEDVYDQLKIPTPIDEEMMTLAHDRSRHRRQESRVQRQSNQALKQIMFAASDLTSDDRMSRRSMMSPRSLSYRSSSSESSAARTPDEARDSHDFWKICLKLRRMVSRGDGDKEQQKLLVTPYCCGSCGTPLTPVVFTPSRSFEVVGAWKTAAVAT